MRYSLLGPTGLKVSQLALGTATLGVAPSAAEGERIVHKALDLGFNLFDTANSYGNQARFDRPGAPPAAEREPAEVILGNALKGHRDRIVLSSKVSEPVGMGVNDAGLSRTHIFHQVENSLRNLRTDYLDMYYAHHPDPAVPMEHVWRAFDDLQKQGKIRHYAMSTFRAWQMMDAAWASAKLGFEGPVCNQIGYSLADRRAEIDVLPACRRLGLSVTVFSPLAGGLLAGPGAHDRTFVGHARWGGPGFSPDEFALAQQVTELAKAAGCSSAALSLAWLATRPEVASAIIGPETLVELEANALAGELIIPDDVLAALDQIGQVYASWTGV